MSSIQRFLSRRERHSRSGRQSKEEASQILSLPLFRGFFTSQPNVENNKEHEKKVKTVENRVRSLGITALENQHFSHALHSTKEDVDKAIGLLLLLEDSIEGIIRGYTPHTKLLGAENRNGVTCYLDALLFAMFARLDCFESILYKAFDDEPRRKLAILFRFWVNLLRTGRLITTDITKHIQDALADCGWKEAALLKQQDASEAFTFITGTLELPLLTLKMDIYHTGKEDVSDDHKFINERLLEVAIPPEPTDGQALTLEDCLEAYFNNRIEVKRYLERQQTLSSSNSADSLCKGFTAHVEEVASSPTISPSPSVSLRGESTSPWASFTEFSASLGSRTPGRRDSIVRAKFIPDPADIASDENETPAPDTQDEQRRGIFRKEVMMPAWQFFSLIPWYTDSTPTNDAQVAAHFSTKRPLLGISLKRYTFTPEGKAMRLNTYIDIPTEIALPHFIQDDGLNTDGSTFGSFKLSLQAMVCHRGDSVDSGHYIAIVRGTSPNVAPPGSSDSSTTTEAPKHWMRFDDLATERVTLVDIEHALKTESPYLLFYQILPIDQDPGMANFSDNAPSSRASDTTLDIDMADISRKLMSVSAEDTEDSTLDGQPSVRPSVEVTRPDGTATQATDHSGSRSSVTFSEAIPNASKSRSVQSSSPKLAPLGEEGVKPSFGFRRGSRHSKSNSASRTGSQAGENRISSTFSKFAGRLNKDRVTSDGDGEGDESAIYADDAALDDVKLGPSAHDAKEKSGKGKGKDRIRKGKGKEKHWDPERECIVM
ncbi:hypothetical protein N7492_000340 [Penicillium capsulatum]|uniref:ubiquitinyl hydrolase 1 n=1 Tax=Penicillium capsulatum TaxID=69766 RepID=A0A9W9LZA4_9EURO|nr:hypothetical protein N7492_000340 [Penicillium capsulatum]KAJ6130596.1 hypothetical protein N7512_003376 [Penicillium capsulatum]